MKTARRSSFARARAPQIRAARFAEVFDELTADWLAAHGALPAVLVRHGGLGFRLARGALSTIAGRLV